MPYTIAQAAEATGNNRTTILRAIKAGKVSATKDAHGNWLVEPAELHRVYPPAQEGARPEKQQRAQVAEAMLAGQITALRETAELLRAQLDDVRKDRDHWRDQAQAVTRQLADARAPQPAETPGPWWRRLVS
jgi:hypothetical protein